MVNGNIKRKKVFITLIIVLCLVVVGAIAVYSLTKDDEVSFEANDDRFFRSVLALLEPSDIEIKSVDAYFLKDKDDPSGGLYYYNFKYNLLVIDEWCEIDEVIYGPYANVQGTFCLNWDNLEDFEGEINQFEKAKNEGIHNTYTDEEIEKLMEEAFEWLKENE